MRSMPPSHAGRVAGVLGGLGGFARQPSDLARAAGSIPPSPVVRLDFQRDLFKHAQRIGADEMVELEA